MNLQVFCATAGVAVANPAKVFEIHHRGNLDAAFVTLKHAYDAWNARLSPVTTSVVDNRKAHGLLASSFHEMRPCLTIVPSWDLADFAPTKARVGDLDAALKWDASLASPTALAHPRW